ncbi:MAG: serine/threonine-protein kinase [Planctomycetota bacterium]
MPDEFFLSSCKYCQHEFRVAAKLVGKQVNCPTCQRQILIAATAKPTEDKLVGKEVGGCKLVRRLGAGALGVVYEAEQKSVGRRIALKMLSSRAASQPEVVARFQREAKLSAAIQHPNVVAVYDCGMDRGVHYLVMEFVDGDTLAGLAEDAGKLDWKTAAGYVKQVAQALEYVHGKDIIHRDIKPANILVGKDGVAKLADLGLAKQIDTGDAAGLTMQGMALGSPAYMPPEQIRNAREAGRTADIYALGASFYQIVSGRLPFEGKNGTEVMTKVLRETATPLVQFVPDLPASVVTLIGRMMDKDPTKRPQDGSALISEIDTLDKPVSTKPRKVASATRTTKRSGSPLVLVMVGVTIIAIAAAIWYFTR